MLTLFITSSTDSTRTWSLWRKINQWIKWRASFSDKNNLFVSLCCVCVVLYSACCSPWLARTWKAALMPSLLLMMEVWTDICTKLDKYDVLYVMQTSQMQITMTNYSLINIMSKWQIDWQSSLRNPCCFLCDVGFIHWFTYILMFLQTANQHWLQVQFQHCTVLFFQLQLKTNKQKNLPANTL